MSQMPNKIWLHKDTKYNTADEVFGYQYEFAEEIQSEGIENFIEYVPLDAFIEKACEWLKKWDAYRVCLEGHKDWFIEQFKKAMKGE